MFLLKSSRSCSFRSIAGREIYSSLVVSVCYSSQAEKNTHRFHSVAFPLECASNCLHRCLHPTNLMKLGLQLRKSDVRLLFDGVAEKLCMH